MRINQIYKSLQGEGRYAGVPTIFVRTQGCSSACSWCDTVYARDPQGGEEMPVSDILKRVMHESRLRGTWVCITGGEPMEQAKDLELLVEALAVSGYKVEVETNGSFGPPGWLNKVDCWVADIKCPSSDEESLVVPWSEARQNDQVKFVVGSYLDLDFVARTLHSVKFRPEVLVSPIMPQSAGIKSNLAQAVWDFCVLQDVRFSIQLHKVVWGMRKDV